MKPVKAKAVQAEKSELSYYQLHKFIIKYDAMLFFKKRLK
jgi:hypothetical protein